MSQNLSMLLAFSAGLLSFLSPCVLPLIPSYISFIGGISFNDLNENKASKSGIFLKTLFFVVGFTTVFMVLGILFSATGGLIGNVTQIINITAGILVILLGINFIFNFWKTLNFEKRFHFSSQPSGISGSLLMGMAFGGGWTPCVGPILASILFLAGSSGKVVQGTLLLGLYSIGLGLPFLLAGLFFSKFVKHTEKIRPHLNTIRIVSGSFLVLIGFIILLGRLQRLNTYFFILANNLESWQQANPRQPRLMFGIIFTLTFFMLTYTYIKRLIIRKKIIFPPVRLVFMFLFLILSILIFAGILNFTQFFTFWFTFQGI